MSEVLSSGQLKEIYGATGGPWGGNYINELIIETLKDVIGWRGIRKICSDEYDEYLELLRSVEQNKRGVEHDSEFSIIIPYELRGKITVPDSHKQNVRVEKEKYLTFSASLMKDIFSSSVDSMIQHVEDLLQKDETRKVSTILLVGGYAASDMVQHGFREKFQKNYKIIIPLTPDMVVLKGAVITGHRVEAIVGRMAKYHYGIGLNTSAVSGRIISIGEDEEKSFFSLISKGQEIKIGDVVTQYEIVLRGNSQWVNLEMYTTDENKPRKIIDNEHFTKIGSIHVKLPHYKYESNLILTISYDETEFKVVATDTRTGRCFVGTCRFLEKQIEQNSN